MTLEGITEAELAAYKSGQSFNKQRARILRRISALKPIDIGVHSLLADGEVERDGEIKNPRRGKLTRLLIKLIPSTLCLLFTVSMMISAKDGIDAGGIISGIVKLSTLPMIGLKGYSAGYLFATESETVWLDTRSRLIEAFLKKMQIECNPPAEQALIQQ